MCISVVFDHYWVLKSTQKDGGSVSQFRLYSLGTLDSLALTKGFKHVEGRPFKIAELNTVFNYLDLPVCYRIEK